jgi:sterol desaturase/sphingolipid hydroxylase (fatty acid hydroxylase superfamily)
VALRIGRRSWILMAMVGSGVFGILLALSAPLHWAIVLALSISLVYQFTLHTERIRKLPKPIELIFNTPSHHRVHHGANHGYLDRNYGGMLIIWDRLFGSFREENERVTYGLTKNVESFNPLKVATHEWSDLVSDVRSAPDLRTKLGYVFHKPGWKPEASSRRDQSAAT